MPQRASFNPHLMAWSSKGRSLGRSVDIAQLTQVASCKVKLGLADWLPQPYPAKQCVWESIQQQAEQPFDLKAPTQAMVVKLVASVHGVIGWICISLATIVVCKACSNLQGRTWIGRPKWFQSVSCMLLPLLLRSQNHIWTSANS